MYFQTLDDKSECVGIYKDGKLHFDNFPTGFGQISIQIHLYPHF